MLVLQYGMSRSYNIVETFHKKACEKVRQCLHEGTYITTFIKTSWFMITVLIPEIDDILLRFL